MTRTSEIPGLDEQIESACGINTRPYIVDQLHIALDYFENIVDISSHNIDIIKSSDRYRIRFSIYDSEHPNRLQPTLFAFNTDTIQNTKLKICMDTLCIHLDSHISSMGTGGINPTYYINYTPKDTNNVHIKVTGWFDDCIGLMFSDSYTI